MIAFTPPAPLFGVDTSDVDLALPLSAASFKARERKPTLRPEWPGITAIACDTPLPSPDVTRIDLSDTVSIAACVLSSAAVR